MKRRFRQQSLNILNNLVNIQLTPGVIPPQKPIGIDQRNLIGVIDKIERLATLQERRGSFYRANFRRI